MRSDATCSQYEGTTFPYRLLLLQLKHPLYECIRQLLVALAGGVPGVHHDLYPFIHPPASISAPAVSSLARCTGRVLSR